ncbi:MAG: hypothetical protein NC548_66110 [Lachnospiraceae bacterium]|nr:hypothetical protein [Lachnospiraceae bacterium]
MAKEGNPIDKVTSWILQEYERVTGQTSFQAATDFPMATSNYYRQQRGKGNARTETQDKILRIIGRTHPEIMAEGMKMLWKSYVVQEEKAEEEIQLLPEVLV